MNIQLYLTITFMFIIYSVANYYIAWRGWQGLKLRRSSLRGKYYKLVIGILAAAYPLARLGETLFPSVVIDNLTLIGAFWLATLYYLCLATLLIDILRFLHKQKTFLPHSLTRHSALIVTLIFCTTIALISYGTWNARHPQTRNYEITIPKAAGSLETLHVVMVSDIHLGNIIDNKRLTKFINRINQLEPDIVLFAGDMIDSKVDVLVNQNMIDNFARLRPKYGTYAILGNHEYFDQKPEVAMKYFEQGNVHILRDQWTLINDSFYLVGRDDLSKERYTGTSRLDLGTLMTGINHTLPILLLDHQPHNLQDGAQEGADLQLSGHTHLGQLFPNNLLTKRMYEVDWGYLRKESLQIIVSCGIGTWGPPVRIGSHPEIVNLTIHFSKVEKQP